MEYFDKFFYEIIAVLVALAVSWFATEPLKRAWRKHTDIQHVLIPRIIAFVLGMVVTWGMWPSTSLWAWWPWGLLAGFGSPFAYRVFIAVLKKRNPELAAAITGVKQCSSQD